MLYVPANIFQRNEFMIQISKNEADYIRRNIPSAFITICSKRKHGTKGSHVSGKTYYCPESNRYISLLEKYRNEGGSIS